MCQAYCVLMPSWTIITGDVYNSRQLTKQLPLASRLSFVSWTTSSSLSVVTTITAVDAARPAPPHRATSQRRRRFVLKFRCYNSTHAGKYTRWIDKQHHTNLLAVTVVLHDVITVQITRSSSVARPPASVSFSQTELCIALAASDIRCFIPTSWPLFCSWRAVIMSKIFLLNSLMTDLVATNVTFV